MKTIKHSALFAALRLIYNFNGLTRMALTKCWYAIDAGWVWHDFCAVTHQAVPIGTH